MIPKIDIYCDSNTLAGGIWIPQVEKGYRIMYSRKLTVNEGEFSAMLVALELAKGLLIDTREIRIYSDSRLVVDAITKGWIKAPNLIPYYKKCSFTYLQLLDHNVKILWIPREQNSIADKISYGKHGGEEL